MGLPREKDKLNSSSFAPFWWKERAVMASDAPTPAWPPGFACPGLGYGLTVTQENGVQRQ